MFSISDFKYLIEQQIAHNKDKSLFYTGANGQLFLNPSKEGIEFLSKNSYTVIEFIKRSKKEGTYKFLLEYMANQSITLFMKVNQYLDFSSEDYIVLQNIYGDLLNSLCNLHNKDGFYSEDLKNLLTIHYKSLQAFLLKTNGNEIFKKYREIPSLLTVKCAEYSPEFQIELLNINLNTIEQPVLDFGCGLKGNLVQFLRGNGIEAIGVDRNTITHDYLFKMNWFEFPLSSNTWGTVISHMAFSNHFIHHHLKTDGNFELYARKYMEIVNSLKYGGIFIYAPSLPFIEELLADNSSFIVERNEYSTKVTRK